MSVREMCPEYGSQQFKKNGHIHNGKQNYQGKTWGRQFVMESVLRLIDAERRTGAERFLCEKISLRGICRALGVSIRWLMDVMVDRFAAVPDDLHAQSVVASHDVELGCLEVEADELWSFVQKKNNPHWLWVVLDKQTRQILAFHVGDRSRESAKQLWANITAVYREQATFYTDHYAAYTGGILAAQHRSLTKSARKTNHIERFKNTLRQRISRLERSTLAFSKKVDNPIGAIRYFICHYNFTRTALLLIGRILSWIQQVTTCPPPPAACGRGCVPCSSARPRILWHRTCSTASPWSPSWPGSG